MAMNMMIEGFAGAGHRVKVIAMNSEKYHVDPASIPDSYLSKTGVEFISVDLRIKAIPAFLNLFSTESYHINRFISEAFKTKVRQVLQQDKFDIVQFEMLHMSPYLELVRKFSAAKTILRAHNVEHIIWQRITENTDNPVKKAYLKHLTKTLKNYETTVAHDYDGIVAITETDASFFRSVLEINPAEPGSIRSERVIAIPFGVDLSRFPDSDTDPDFPSLFSIGSMDWNPNIEGMTWFLEHVWPIVHLKNPSVRFYLAGRHMPDWIKRKEIPNVEVVGEVPDSLEFISRKAIMIVPLLSGSGIRIKIIEGMAAGKPIVSTTIGAEGIRYTPGKDMFIADQPEDFAEVILKLVNDKELCMKTGRNARKLAEEEYDQQKLIRKLLGFYENTIL